MRLLNLYAVLLLLLCACPEIRAQDKEQVPDQV